MKESSLFPFQATETQTNFGGVGWRSGSDFLAYIKKESKGKGAAESKSSTMSSYVTCHMCFPVLVSFKHLLFITEL